MKTHEELGDICNEHEHEIEELVEYYRKKGGVGHLVPNPSVPLVEFGPHLPTNLGVNILKLCLLRV